MVEAGKGGRTVQNEGYHYVECGLDDVYLANGFERTVSARGTSIAIRDIDALHRAIGGHLCRSRKGLNGKEIRFLRREMLMSQTVLAHLLDVSEQTIYRWEAVKSGMPRAAESLLRLLYTEQLRGDRGSIRDRLARIADLEDRIDSTQEMVFELSPGDRREWALAA